MFKTPKKFLSLRHKNGKIKAFPKLTPALVFHEIIIFGNVMFKCK